MHYYQLVDGSDSRLAVLDDNVAYDLTAAKSAITSYLSLVRAADITGQSVDKIARALIDDAAVVPFDDVQKQADVPLPVDEVWAAGVTYHMSEKARETESENPDMYLRVYESDRPEIFFKATPNRVVGPGSSVGIREDSTWNDPEPELGVVLHNGTIAGFTVGNDMSSRSIEGSNPLYLPQAKVYQRCCSLGPCIVSMNAVSDPLNLDISMKITRNNETLYNETTNTSEMVRSIDELVSYYNQHNEVPELAVLLTGTSLVPDDDFTLHAGDRITISIESIGELENTVTVV